MQTLYTEQKTLDTISTALFEVLKNQSASFYPCTLRTYYRGKTDKRLTLTCFTNPDKLKDRKTHFSLTIYLVGNHLQGRGTYDVTNIYLLPPQHLIHSEAGLVQVKDALVAFANIWRGIFEIDTQDLITNKVLPNQEYYKMFTTWFENPQSFKYVALDIITADKGLTPL